MPAVPKNRWALKDRKHLRREYESEGQKAKSLYQQQETEQKRLAQEHDQLAAVVLPARGGGWPASASNPRAGLPPWSATWRSPRKPGVICNRLWRSWRSYRLA